ncbi:hypothetical protein FNV43_RR26792 [Rhamnella rubrinervis]|uniref:Uncharacterized protein n=1 Tax=Rhamnella rubrinervis TaxID=2594499 RepID=A0A8K0DN78_9ROSA|nr:hypothetical protein FNV43_RR26792 [Rhamnella rubrinervis]
MGGPLETNCVAISNVNGPVHCRISIRWQTQNKFLMEQSQLQACKANEVSKTDEAILKLESLKKEYPNAEESLCHLQEILRKENPDLGTEICDLKGCLYVLCELLVRQQQKLVTLRAQPRVVSDSFRDVVNLLKEYAPEIGIDESVKELLKALRAGKRINYADREILEVFGIIIERMREAHIWHAERKVEIMKVLQKKRTKQSLEEARELLKSYEAGDEALKEHHAFMLKKKDDTVRALLRLEIVGEIGESFRQLLKALEAVVEKLKGIITWDLKQLDDFIHELFRNSEKRPLEQEEEPSTSDKISYT